MERYAVIDMGSNSIRLLKCTVSEGKILSAEKSLIMTRLGEGVHETGRLSERAMSQTCEAVKLFAKEAQAYEGHLLGAFATSAVRDSGNRQQLVDAVRQQTGVEVEVIDGAREAKLGFIGVLSGLSKPFDTAMVIDIGGGSTEIIVGGREGIRYAKSFNMGAVRMTELFLTSDPPQNTELELLRERVRALSGEIQEICRQYRPEVAVGIGGTITTVGAVALGMVTYDRSKIHQYALSKAAIDRIFSDFTVKSLAERSVIPGLQPKRADIITAGTAILQEVMVMGDFDTVQVSDYDNLEGILAESGILKF